MTQIRVRIIRNFVIDDVEGLKKAARVALDDAIDYDDAADLDADIEGHIARGEWAELLAPVLNLVEKNQTGLRVELPFYELDPDYETEVRDV